MVGFLLQWPTIPTLVMFPVLVGRLEWAMKEVLSELELAAEFLQKQEHQVILVGNLAAEDALKKAMESMGEALQSSESALLQYFFAADRNNANVRESYQPENPGFLRMLKRIVDTAKEQDKPLVLCGEIAADPELLALLVGLGIENLSMGIHALPGVADSLTELSIDSCRLLAQECLHASTTAEVG